MTTITMNEALDRAGTGPYQYRLMGIFGLVWAADAMQVLAVGFTAASIAATFGLTVPQALQTGTLFFLGMLIGAVGFGRLADRIGRRRVLIVTVACDAIFGLLSIFAPSFGVLLLLRFLTGAAVGGTLPVDYAMMSEFLPARSRGRWLVMLEGFWAVGTLIVAVTAWLVALSELTDAWRYIFAVTALPAVLGLGLRFLVPESPLYLLRAGKAVEAKAIVNRMLVANRHPQLETSVSIALPAASPSVGIFSGDLRRRSLLILAVWFLVSVSYYGVFTWMPPRLAGKVSASFVAMGSSSLSPWRRSWLCACRLWRRGMGTPANAGRLLSPLRPKLPPFRRGKRRGCHRSVAADHEFCAARHLGRALCLYAGTLSNGVAGNRNGGGRWHGAAWRSARTLLDRHSGGPELRSCDRHLCGVAVGGRNRRLPDRCGDPSCVADVRSAEENAERSGGKKRKSQS